VHGDRYPELTFEVIRADALTAGDEQQIASLFERSYEDADVGYLRESLPHLRTVSVARLAGAIVGFSLSDSRRIDLPRLPAQVVRLAGLACVADALRRRGVMNELSRLGVISTGFADEPGLVCGRMANPATYRGMLRLPSAVPKPGVSPSAWHREVGTAIASAYGVRRFDPETFVCGGRGRPIGHPRIAIDATAEEWEMFRHVDRSKGESLLGFAWLGPAPAGW
jgi:hypothetical protein